MASRRTLLVVGIALLASVATSGCLVEEFVPEPWVWRDVGTTSDEFQSPNYTETTSFELADRTNRVRAAINVTLEETQSGPITSSLEEGPGLRMNVTTSAGNSYTYFFDESDAFEDLYPGSGDGPVEVRVEARGQGSWTISLEAYEPEYEDWTWYAFWERW